MAKILLVDDSKTVLKHLSRMLNQGGHQVTAVASGAAAVEYLAQAAVDVVITDLYMPPPDGFEIVQSVRDMPCRPPLIVMSSNTLACGVFRDARALGAAAALQKPFTAEKLLATVAEVLESTAAASAPVPSPSCVAV